MLYIPYASEVKWWNTDNSPMKRSWELMIYLISHPFRNWELILFIFFKIPNWIWLNYQIYLFKSPNIFSPITEYICLNHQIYLSRSENLWVSQFPAPPIPSFIAQPPRSAQINQCWISFKIDDHIWMKQMASIFDLNYI